MGDYETAKQFLNRALAINKEDSYALSQLAAVLLATGDSAGARRLYERALTIQGKLGPESPWVAESQDGLARLLITAGDFEEARPLCEHALRIREQRSLEEHEREEVIERLEDGDVRPVVAEARRSPLDLLGQAGVQ